MYKISYNVFLKAGLCLIFAFLNSKQPYCYNVIESLAFAIHCEWCKTKKKMYGIKMSVKTINAIAISCALSLNLCYYSLVMTFSCKQRNYVIHFCFSFWCWCSLFMCAQDEFRYPFRIITFCTWCNHATSISLQTSTWIERNVIGFEIETNSNTIFSSFLCAVCVTQCWSNEAFGYF